MQTMLGGGGVGGGQTLKVEHHKVAFPVPASQALPFHSAGERVSVRCCWEKVI